MAFEGWGNEAVEFFEQLTAENTKTFWLAHKPVYEREVLAPMQALLADLAPEFGPGRLFRPYRDVRFSTDKSPYKTTIAAMVGPTRYVQFSADGLGAGVGLYDMSPDQLDRYRRAVDEDRTGKELQRIVAALARRDATLMSRETLKTAPRGYAKNHPRIELLRHKGIGVWRETDPADWLDSPQAVPVLTGFFRDAKPLEAWIARNVGTGET